MRAAGPTHEPVAHAPSIRMIWTQVQYFGTLRRVPNHSRPVLAAARTDGRAAKGGVDRARAILLAAERLFATDGYPAVSLRRIADEAGVPLGLIDYHYGRKDDLYCAVFARGRRNVQARVAALQAAPSGKLRPPSCKAQVRRIVEAFVAPVLERTADGPPTYALLAARELLTRDTPLNRQVLREQFDPMAHAFIDALSQTFPAATRGQAAWCYQFALGAFVHHLTDHRVERLSRGENRRRDPAGAAMLTRFIVGGILEALTSRRAAAT